MNDIKIVTLFKLSSSYSIMAEGVGCVVDNENGSFYSQSWAPPAFLEGGGQSGKGGANWEGEGGG